MPSKFLQSSSSFSETSILKSKYLVPILESYNNLILKQKVDKIDIKEVEKFMIPNNNNKYYMFVTNKFDTTNNKNDSKYKILYFFPVGKNEENNLFRNLTTDFFVEIDSVRCNFTKSNYLFEGYLYHENAYNTFLISDILSVDNKVIDCDYSLRYNLVNDIIKKQNLLNLNGHLNIDVHSMFSYDETSYLTILKMFQNNFKFKNEIVSLDIINETNLLKSTSLIKSTKIEGEIIKRITKGKFIDVYNVCNIETNNNEGILYIRTLDNSKQIRRLFDNKENIGETFIEMPCEYNLYFKKWSIKRK